MVRGETVVKTQAKSGIFIYIIDPDAKHIHYDDEFKRYATLTYVHRDLNTGEELSRGDFEKCESELLAPFKNS